MKSISKAMIAVMIAAAMCVVPLFVIEDSEAVTITSGEKAVSFEAGSITDEKFDGLVTPAYKDYLADKAFDVIFPSSYEWAIVGHATVKNVKDVKLSLGNSVAEDKITNVTASAITFDVVMTARCNDMSDGTTLFALKDGTQVLYKELGTYTVAYNAEVTIEGKVTVEEYEYKEVSIAKNSANNYVTKEIVGKHSSSISFDGKVKVNALDKTYELNAKEESGGEAKVTPDYYNAEKIEDVTNTSKVVLNWDNGNPATKEVFNYKIGDKSGGYDVKEKEDMMMMMGMDYLAGTVEDLELMLFGEFILIYDADISPMPVSYYDDAGVLMTNCLFTPGTVSIADPTNEKVKNYLADVGTVSDEYSTAKSVANGAYTPVSADGSGGNNIIFYVIIGVLAVAVVALAVLMIKKK